MIRKELRLSTGEKIYIYDNVYASNDVGFFQSFLEKSNYCVGTTSVITLQRHTDTFFQCRFSEIDLNNFGIFEREETKQILIEHNLINIDRYWALLSTHLSQYQYHTDNFIINKKTFLYYANRQWDKNWGGETLFCNNKGELEIAIEFKPNRVVIFDSHIEHKPAPLSLSSYPYRYIFTAQFK